MQVDTLRKVEEVWGESMECGRGCATLSTVAGTASCGAAGSLSADNGDPWSLFMQKQLIEMEANAQNTGS